MIKLFIYICYLFIVYNCKDIDDTKKQKAKTNNINLFFLSQIAEREKGNCLRIEKTSTGNVLYCSRLPSGLCNTNEIILTQGEVNKNRFDSLEFINSNPECSFSFGLTGLLNDKANTFAEEDTIKANNNYISVSSCESAGFQITNSIANVNEINFLNSAKGRIAIAADRIINTPDLILATQLVNLNTSVIKAKSDATICLNRPFSKNEVDLVIELRTNLKSKSTTCNFTSTNICPTTLERFK